jgi:hypothetical protein
MYCEQHLADSGVMTKHQPSAQVQSDIEFGWLWPGSSARWTSARPLRSASER